MYSTCNPTTVALKALTGGIVAIEAHCQLLWRFAVIGWIYLALRSPQAGMPCGRGSNDQPFPSESPG